MSDEPWYGVKCVFRHDDLPSDKPGTIYEERVVLVRADSFAEALAKAEAEAEQYSHGGGTTYVGYANAYHLHEEEIGDGTEVYSLMRTSELDDDAFIARYFNDGTQHSQDFEA